MPEQRTDVPVRWEIFELLYKVQAPCCRLLPLLRYPSDEVGFVMACHSGVRVLRSRSHSRVIVLCAISFPYYLDVQFLLQ